jgi:hypothetical protein
LSGALFSPGFAAAFYHLDHALKVFFGHLSDRFRFSTFRDGDRLHPGPDLLWQSRNGADCLLRCHDKKLSFIPTELTLRGSSGERTGTNTTFTGDHKMAQNLIRHLGEVNFWLKRRG